MQFTGTVLVPDHLSTGDARLLANKLALARILATIDNPDAPDDDACEDYIEECSSSPTSPASCLKLISEEPPRFHALGRVAGKSTTVTLRPLYMIHHQRFAVYLKVAQ